METTVAKPEHVATLKAHRKRHRPKAGENVKGADEIRLGPVHAGAIRALRGHGRGERLTERLLASRQEEKRLG